MKDGAEILAKPLSEICNLSIICQKSCKAQTVFKKVKETDPSNCRPISLLLLICKVLERVIQDKANEFPTENNLLYNYQSEFRTNHSTNLCQLFLTGNISNHSDEGLLTGMTLTDLKKAFETITDA